jgi:hypothetical protein
MTNAQKVELRYQYIMAHTTKAQGDAARTADGFANSSRALKDNLKDLGTSIGQKLLPVAGALIKWANLGIEAFRELARKSNIAEGALIAVAAAIAAMNAAAIADMLPALTAMLLLAAAIDEVITTMNGGQSLIRDWIDGWKGVGATDELVRNLKESLKDLDGNMPDMVTSWNLLEDSIDDVGYAVQQLIGEFERLLKMPIAAPLQWMDKLDQKIWSMPGLKQVHERLEENDKKYLQEHGVANPLAGGRKWYGDDTPTAVANYRGSEASATTSLQGKIEMRRARKGRAYVEEQAARHERVRQRRVKENEAQSSRSKTQDIQDAGMSMPAAEPAVSVEPPLSLAAPASSAPAVTNNISNVTINNGDINMSTDSSMSDARRGAQAAQAERRRTADSLKRGG